MAHVRIQTHYEWRFTAAVMCTERGDRFLMKLSLWNEGRSARTAAETEGPRGVFHRVVWQGHDFTFSEILRMLPAISRRNLHGSVNETIIFLICQWVHTSCTLNRSSCKIFASRLLDTRGRRIEDGRTIALLVWEKIHRFDAASKPTFRYSLMRGLVCWLVGYRKAIKQWYNGSKSWRSLSVRHW
jgi:hypothetical protein